VGLCGRQVERAVIAGLIEGACAFRSGALVLRGPPGVGKSALLEDAAGRAEGMLVLRAAGVESEAEFAFAGLHQLLRPVLGWLDRIPDHLAAALGRAVGLEPSVAVAADDRFLVALAVLALVAEVAEVDPLLCLVDDAHWLDDESAMALVFVARRLVAERVAVVFAIRDGETRAFPAAGLPQLRLQGLDAETAGELLTARGAAPVSADVRDRLVEWTGGNPLALVELPSVLTAGQLAGHEPLPSRLPLTETVQRVFAERAGRLPEPSRRALLVAAAEDTGRLAVVLAAAKALGVQPEAFDGAECAGLVRVRDGTLTFDHPLVRSAVYQGATSAERRRTHAAVAGTPHLASDLVRRAWHLALAAAPDDEKAVADLEDAARHTAERGGFAAASAALERAAELTTDSVIRGRRLVAAAQHAWQAGLLRRVTELVRAARQLVNDPALLAQLGMLHAMVELNVGSSAAALRILTGAAHDAAVVDPPFARRALAAAAEAAWLASDRDAGSELRALAAGLDPPVDGADQFFAELVDGFLAFAASDLHRAFSALHSAVATAVRDGRSELLLMVTFHVFYLGDDDAAQRLPAARVTAARSAGAALELLFALPPLVQAEIFCGRLAAAAAAAGEAVRLARETGQPELSALPLAWLTHLAAVRGDEHGFWASLAETEQVAATHQLGVYRHPVHEILLWARAVQKAQTARPGSALALLEQQTHPVVIMWAAVDRVEAAIAAGKRDKALRWLAEFETFAAHAGQAWADARVAHCHGLLAAGPPAVASFEQALALHRAAERPFERARTELAYGGVLRRMRKRMAARQPLVIALDIFEGLGAAPWAERARQELRACGQTARKRNPSTLLQLTPQELQVARFVANGLPTREVAAQLFLSPRTVDFHLRNVFTKLGISSRSELSGLDLH
jgi:DNA-binding CsgD family transcriptional regulator